MPQKQYRPEEIIGKLREAEVLLSQGINVEEVCRNIEVTKMTYYRWRIPHVKLGRLVRFSQNEIQEWLNKKRKKQGRARRVVEIAKPTRAPS
jgi:excisionase family DNA binding protein